MSIITKKDLNSEITQGLHNTVIAAEAKYSINFTESRK